MGRYDQTKDKKPAGVTVFIVIILLILTGGGWFYFKHLQMEDGAAPETTELKLPPASKVISANESVSPSTSIDEAIPDTEAVNAVAPALPELPFVLPDLPSSDGAFRETMTMVSPGLAPWLSADQLIVKYVFIANDFSQGLWIEKHMRFLKQAQPFSVEETANGLFMSKQSYHRYDKLAAAIDAMNVRSTLAVYKKFRPLMLQVFAEFSYPADHTLEDIFEKTASEILAAPVIEEPVALVRPSVLYKFADKKLEVLSPVSKQMIRMGPENTRIIQNKIRQLIQELANMKESVF